jgi:hypothetical protein
MAEFGAGPGTVDDILASTLSVSGDELTQQWMTGFPLTKKLMEDDLVVEVEGGNDIREPIEYQNASSAQWANDASIIDTSVRQIMTEMQVSWKMLFGSVATLFSEEAKNMGKYQKINLVKARLENLLNTKKHAMEEAFFTADASVNADAPWSLDEIVDASDPTRANYGGIDRNTYTWWQGWEVDGSSSGGFATAGIETVRAAELATSQAMTDRVGMHFTSQTLYAAYQARLVQQEMFSKGDKGDLEFDSLLFAGKPVYWSPQCVSTVWYGLNTKHMKFFINKAMRFKDYGWTQVPGGLSKSKLIGTMCQLISKAPYRNFKITGMAA